jgi:hypothetical protein
LLVVLYGCETWSLTLRKEHRLRVFENRLPKREEVLRGVSCFVLLTKYYSDAESKEDEMGGACGTYGGKLYTAIWWENMRERDCLEDFVINWSVILK